MLNRDVLKSLGWSDELIAIVEEVSASVPEQDLLPTTSFEAISDAAPAVGGDSIQPGGPPVGGQILRVV